MKRFLKCMIILAVGVFMMTGTASAWNLEEHVTVSPNGKGDAGIFPLYVALDGGWETKLEVINTSPTDSVVAKVVVRSAMYSQELLDFFIYLSPRDVWTGYVNYGPNGARLYSTDDSCHAGTRATGPLAAWASPANPMNVELYDHPCDINEIGYVEIIEAWNANLGIALPVPKDDVEDAWIASTPGVGTANVLAMHYEINVLPLYHAANRAVVLRDYDVTDKLSLGIETFLGSTAGSASRNSICEVEAVIAKNLIAMPFYAGNSAFATLHTLTFPTKYTGLSAACVITGVKSPFFNQNMDEYYCISFGLPFWDLEENTPEGQGNYSPVPPSLTFEFCYEVNFVSPTSISALGYDEGWIEYVFNYSTTCAPEGSATDRVQFTGAPVIPLNLSFKGTGMAIMDGAWTDSVVEYNDVLQPFYTYGPFPW